MQRQWRRYDLDQRVLLFDRTTGTNVLVEDEATKGVRRVAPRTVQIALTNSCNVSDQRRRDEDRDAA